VAQTYGDFKSIRPKPDTEYLNLSFSPSSTPLMQRWRNNGLSADFLGDYVTTFFPRDDGAPSTERRQNEVRGAVSYIANELLENAMKYSDGSSGVPISISLFLCKDFVAFMTTNGVGDVDLPLFRLFIEELQSGDTGEMFMRRLEQNAVADDGSSAGLGYLTMINDYGARLAWRIGNNDAGANTATTQVILSI